MGAAILDHDGSYVGQLPSQSMRIEDDDDNNNDDSTMTQISHCPLSVAHARGLKAVTPLLEDPAVCEGEGFSSGTRIDDKNP